jgi:hypothetical protein
MKFGFGKTATDTELIKRVQQLEQAFQAVKPDLHFPSSATLEQRVRWLEIVLGELMGDGAKALRELGHTVTITGTGINVGGYKVTNMGVPTAAGDALRKGTRLTMAEVPDGALGQVLTAQGPGVDPVYAPAVYEGAVVAWNMILEA